ncbi:MAG: YHS domain-containing protein [Acidobacteria bacterium]|nr:YHS domain-containing protein [Acidobacteriota bacterium]MBV9477592.1 YHS domain-containing protein [Acidobacteriota bacterium]
MRRIAVLLSAVLLLAACDATTAPQQNAQSEMRTISSAPPRPAPLDAPPTLQDEAPPPKPKAMPWETPTPIVFTPDDEKLRASLPFTPAIAMDPIDGSKISIRAATPTFEFKGKIYYFSSDDHKRTFMSKPEEYAKGVFTKL